MKRFLISAAVALLVSAAAAGASAATTLAPAEHGTFDHYTFALTWQPGICSTEEGCLPDQPKSPLIGLHGLWASLPQDLSSQGIADPQWWSKGCDLYRHSSEAPPLDATLDSQLVAVMPHFQHSLLTHEYDKHVQCFGFDPTQFFATALAMRAAIESSAFGAYLQQQAGHDVSHADVVEKFKAAFSTEHGTALQLECGRNAAGQVVLTQFWFQIPASELEAFPKPASFMDTPSNEDTCPASFRIPSW
jgi:ribonuclease I